MFVGIRASHVIRKSGIGVGSDCSAIPRHAGGRIYTCRFGQLRVIFMLVARGHRYPGGASKKPPTHLCSIFYIQVAPPQLDFSSYAYEKTLRFFAQFS